MSALITKAQACANARAVLDEIRMELAEDYAAGRLTGPRLAAYERLLAEQRAGRQAPAAAAA